MSNICTDSPMFDYVEQIAGRQIQHAVDEEFKKAKSSEKKITPVSIDDQILGQKFEAKRLKETEEVLAFMKLSGEEVRK